jgi:hypothetical protein
MQSGFRLLVEEHNDQKRIRREFDDNRIHFGRNAKTKELEVWYKTGSSAPYKVCTCNDVWHGISQLHHRSKFDHGRAVEMMKRVDENNDKLQEGKRKDAMHEFKSGLADIANGKVMFMPPRN